MKKLVVGFCLLLSQWSFAQDQDPGKYGMVDEDIPIGLEVGETAPEIDLKDQNGNSVKLYEALKKGPVVLTFYRGNWCPYCSRYLSNLNDSIQLIVDKGATFMAVSPESAEHVNESAEGLSENIKVLSDTEGKVMKDYDVDFEVSRKYQNRVLAGKQISLKKFNDQEKAILPVPATYIINSEGKIIYRFFDLNYSKRASVKAILQGLSLEN